MKNFRKNHILNILKTFEKVRCPLDLFLSKYFRDKKSIGSKDRKIISEKIYKLIRWRGLIDYFSKKPLSFENRLKALEEINFEKAIKDQKIPSHIKVSFPKKYFNKIEEQYGVQKTLEICLISNTKAPTTIRINPLKTTRDFLLKAFEEYKISKCLNSKYGIVFHKKINFFALSEFKEGLFEMQDEGSQIVASLMEPSKKDKVLDFCAGSGGKTLAFAHKMENKGQIYLYDIRESSLLNAKKRLKRAGIQNFQILKKSNFKKFKNKMDWILLDVPCSGSGTLRRNPDMKWKFEIDSIEDLKEKQRSIFEEAFPLLKEEGYILYATCSIFKEENEEQIKYFLENYPLKEIKQAFWLPEENGKDGFFASLLQKDL
jgi:16S rRNA (cytosine(967)-C(5))-methyltransferase